MVFSVEENYVNRFPLQSFGIAVCGLSSVSGISDFWSVHNTNFLSLLFHSLNRMDDSSLEATVSARVTFQVTISVSNR